jgi:hypothetical protein
MSTSPVQANTRQPSPPDRPKSDRLSRSQALLITAGLAGFIGLSSGIIMRFSLSNSSSARFLSPLQTFPDLPDWAPELPQGTADSHYLPGGGFTETGASGSAAFDSSVPRSQSFDADETAEPSPTDDVYSEAESYSPDTSSDSGYSQETTQDSYGEEPPAEEVPVEESYAEPYPEQAPVEEPYTEPYPEEPYIEDDNSSENYPETEAPIADESADYENGQY